MSSIPVGAVMGAVVELSGEWEDGGELEVWLSTTARKVTARGWETREVTWVAPPNRGAARVRRITTSIDDPRVTPQITELTWTVQPRGSLTVMCQPPK